MGTEIEAEEEEGVTGKIELLLFARCKSRCWWWCWLVVADVKEAEADTSDK